MILAPGIVDIHMHLTGGGGEGGPLTRAPEASIDELVRAGTTTAVGLLGTDSFSRSLENLLSKVRAINVSLLYYVWCGAVCVCVCVCVCVM